MNKTFQNEGGNILVRATGDTMGPGIVDMLHLYNKNKSGCSIGCWERRLSDGKPIAEFQSIHDRFITTKYSFDIMEALRFGQKLADLLIETENEKDPTK